MQILENAKRIVIKVGSSLMIDPVAGEEIRREWLQSLCDDIALLMRNGKEVVLVSSGAVALGRKKLKSDKVKASMKLYEKQAAAACGQVELMNVYKHDFAPHLIEVAQNLLTIEDSEERRRYMNARNALGALLDAGIVPIVNENDTVATRQLRVGDNDRLAARVAQMVGADVLVLMSDVDGLYTANPRRHEDAEHIPVVDDITDDIIGLADGVGSTGGSGGMLTKIKAAQMATMSGCAVVIMDGQQPNPLARLKAGERHTLFTVTQNSRSAWKQWIAHSLNTGGELVLDNGAVKALQSGRSLLPVGIAEVKGQFEKGDTVVLLDETGQRIGCGMVAYDADETEMLKGEPSEQIEEILGYNGPVNIIHRDDLVMD